VFSATVVDAPGAPQKPKEEKPSPHREARMKLIKELTGEPGASAPGGDLLQFVRRSSLQTYTAVESLRRLMKEELGPMPPEARQFGRGQQPARLFNDLNLVAKMIRAGFGTRIFYVSIDGFDTHANQKGDHFNLMQQLGNAVMNFFQQLQQSGDDKRVLLLTFSEFGRRVKENGSKGTDHGAGSCLFLAGPQAKAGLVGKHPSLADLDAGDLKHHTDFRRVYATLLDKWLECNSEKVLGAKFPHAPVLKG